MQYLGGNNYVEESQNIQRIPLLAALDSTTKVSREALKPYLFRKMILGLGFG